MATREMERRLPRSRAVGWMGRHWVSIVLALVAVVYGGAVTMLHEDTVSPIDEVVYLDYAFKVWDQGIVHEGEQFGEDVAHVVACENVIPHGDLGQVCGSEDVNMESMPNQGYTTGSGYTPAYFWSVRLIGDPIHALTGLSEVTSWRLSGLVWLVGTLLVLVPLLRRAGVSSSVTLTLGALFIASPYSWWTYTYLSTDASVVLFGAAVLFVSMEVVRGRRSAWWLLPLAALAPLFKITNLLVFGLMLVYFGITAIAQRFDRSVDSFGPQRFRISVRVWIPVALSVAVAGLVQVVWMRIVPALAVSDVVVDQGVTTPLTGAGLIRLVLRGISGPITHNPFGGFSSQELSTQVFVPLSWLMIAMVIGALMVMRWDLERGPVIWATGIASLTALPALGIAMWTLSGIYFELPGRYGAGLIPAMLLVGGFMLRNRFANIMVLVYAVLLMVFGIALALHVGAAY